MKDYAFLVFALIFGILKGVFQGVKQIPTYVKANVRLATRKFENRNSENRLEAIRPNQT